MIRGTRMLAGTAAAAVLVAGTLLAGTRTTSAQWQAALEDSGVNVTITTGGLGVTQQNLTESRGTGTGVFVWGNTRMIELDQAYQEQVTLTAHALPNFSGSGPNAIVLEANFRWARTSEVQEGGGAWLGLSVTSAATYDGQRATPRITGTAWSSTGITLSVLVWPQSAGTTPSPWGTESTVRYTDTMPQVDFSLTIQNTGHDLNFALGAIIGAGLTGWASENLLYYPSSPQLGVLTITARQINTSGTSGPWYDTSTLSLPVIFNANGSQSTGTITIAGNPPVAAEMEAASPPANPPVPDLQEMDPPLSEDANDLDQPQWGDEPAINPGADTDATDATGDPAPPDSPPEP